MLALYGRPGLIRTVDAAMCSGSRGKKSYQRLPNRLFDAGSLRLFPSHGETGNNPQRKVRLGKESVWFTKPGDYTNYTPSDWPRRVVSVMEMFRQQSSLKAARCEAIVCNIEHLYHPS